MSYMIFEDNKIYKAMVIGVALFVGGMITILLITRYLTPSATANTVVLKEITKPRYEEKTMQPQPKIIPYIPVSNEEGFNISVDVSDEIIELYQQKDGFPWNSCDITNNGPSPVYVCVNQWKEADAPLEVGNTWNIPYNRGSIRRVFLKCDAGNSTRVSMYVLRG